MPMKVAKTGELPMRTLPAERVVHATPLKVQVRALEERVAFLEAALKRRIVDFPSFEPKNGGVEGVCEVWGEIEVPASFSDPQARAFRALASDFGVEVALDCMLKLEKEGAQDDL